MERAVFYLLWQGDMRLSEVKKMRLEDLGLRIGQGKVEENHRYEEH